MTPDLLALLTNPRPAGFQRGTGGRVWSWEDLGIAAGAITRHEFAAFMLPRTADPRYRSDLVYPLLERATKIRLRERWSKRFRNELYLEDLAYLALDTWTDPGLEKRESGYFWRRRFPEVDGETWDRFFRRKYEGIRTVLVAWEGNAAKAIRDQIRGEGRT